MISYRGWLMAMVIILAMVILGLFVYAMCHARQYTRRSRKICECGHVHYHSVEDSDHHQLDDPDEQ